LARVAPALLGPSYTRRLEALETETARLLERNRIARELHDSIGHALSVVTLQAGAARRRLGAHDPDFADEALDAIESTARSATAELDHVLGLLRDGAVRDNRDGRPALSLDSLQALIATTQRAGLTVHADVSCDLDGLPGVVSHEAYRIVQEGLTNALRHAPDGIAHLSVGRSRGRLLITITNATRGGVPRLTGRGMRGLAERVQALGGSLANDDADGTWRLAVELPLPRTRD
jgi:signal transduction histidine kinase